MRVVVRADASPEIGSGHIMRCLTLADALASGGARVTFLTRAGAGPLLDQIRARGHEVHLLADDPLKSAPSPSATAHDRWLPVTTVRDAEQAAVALGAMAPVDWLIVDHYALDAAWERAMRPLARQILAIDDLADRPHDCDLLLDQRFAADKDVRYDGLVPASARQLIGPTYALLRPEYAVSRRTQRTRDGSIRRVLVFFGGADASNETTKAIEALRLLNHDDLAIDVVLGVMCPHAAAVRAALAALPNASFHQGVASMATLMVAADLAIGAGGGATWERCSLGLPTIALTVADNQRAGLIGLAGELAVLHLGEAVDVDASRIAATVAFLIANPAVVRAMSKAAANMADGRGVDRVLAALGTQPVDVMLRPADADDEQRLLDWRNHPTTRAVSLTQHEIGAAEHRAWFARALADPLQVILIAEIAGMSVGVVRFTISGREAMVSIALDPQFRGRGVGAATLRGGLQWLAEFRPEVRHLAADILPGNARSRRLFEEAGFVPHVMTYTRALKA